MILEYLCIESEKEYNSCKQKYFLVMFTNESDSLMDFRDMKILHLLSKTGYSLQVK